MIKMMKLVEIMKKMR